MIFVDSNVLIDIVAADQQWKPWSDMMIDRLNRKGEQLIINPIVIAELASNFSALADLLRAMETADIEVVPLDDEVAFGAGQAFRAYRRQHRDRDAILSDFLIGGHARHFRANLLTRDAAIYRAYFPDLPLITPETHPNG